MASLIRDKNRQGEYNGCRTLQFLDSNSARKSVRLGKVTAKAGETIKTKVEAIQAASYSGYMDSETAAWIGNLATNNAKLYDKLSAVGLLPERTRETVVTLGKFVDGYIAGRLPTVKRSTALVYRHTRDNLVTYFGAGKILTTITPGDADEWRAWLTLPKKESIDGRNGRGLADNTARRRCGVARQFLQAARRKRLIIDNPFAEMREGVTVRSNKARDYFVTRLEADKLIATCPNDELALMIALSRYGGLRCPSEHLALTWGDVNWDDGRITIKSPKTAHHEGHESRVIPLFEELRTHLQTALDAILEDFDPKANRLSEQPIIRRYRSANVNLRTQVLRIIKRAGLTPWPKLFHNMRASRATEWARDFPGHVAATWSGHSEKVAAEHYWRVTDEDFVRALQMCKHNTDEPQLKQANEESEEAEILAESLISGEERYARQDSNLRPAD